MEQIKKIKELLIALGITPTLKGYDYLAVAIDNVLTAYKAGEKKVDFLILYKAIAFMNDVKAMAVEHAMRYAIIRAFKVPSAPLLKSIFTFIPDSEHATVSCFICTVAQHLYYEE